MLHTQYRDTMEQRTSNIKVLRMQALSILSVSNSFLDSDDFTPIATIGDPYISTSRQIRNEGTENFEEQEFSFAGTDAQGTLVFADEIFDNGQIRPIFPAFDQSLLFESASSVAASPLRPPLRKLLVEHHYSFCSKGKSGVLREPSNEPSLNMTLVEVDPSNEHCKKSNSTGFSKLWRFRRDLKLRSNSDCRDAFVFFNPPMPPKSNEGNVHIKKETGGKNKATMSAHEKLYVMNRKRKEGNKRRSFLPYRQHLVGLFSDVNRFSRNIHPF